MKILVAGVVIMATISIGGYAISRNVGGEKKEKIPGCFDRIQQILRVLVDLSTVISMILPGSFLDFHIFCNSERPIHFHDEEITISAPVSSTIRLRLATDIESKT